MTEVVQPEAPSAKLPDPDSPYGQLGAAFKRAMVAVRKMRGRETHRPGQLSYAQYSLLFGLAGVSHCSAKSLAEQADLTPATVTQMLESLEKAGLVTRERSLEDRRVVLTALTDRGQELVAERHARMRPLWEAALSEFDEAELAAATRVLSRLADYFSDLAEEQPA